MFGNNSRLLKRPTRCSSLLLLLLHGSFELTPLANSLKLKALHRFTSTAAAVEDITAMQEGKMSKGLKAFLTEQVVEKGKGKAKLAVVDKTLGVWRSFLISAVKVLGVWLTREISCFHP